MQQLSMNSSIDRDQAEEAEKKAQTPERPPGLSQVPLLSLRILESTSPDLHRELI